MLNPFSLIATFLITISAVTDLKQVNLLKTPDPSGHRVFVQAIDSARKSIDIVMFHLSDPKVIRAIHLAQQRGVSIRIILDRKSLTSKLFRTPFEALLKWGVQVRRSSPAFSITHQKSMVIDNQEAWITSMNFTRNAQETLDLGIATHDAAIISEMNSVFNSDWNYFDSQRAPPPKLSEAHLIWSPIDSRQKLIELIESAKSEIVSTVENLGDPKILSAFENSEARKVQIRLLLPMCDKNSNPLYNYPFIKKLLKAGVNIRVMPSPESPDHPYIHLKMILVDEKVSYVGSVNFSTNSTTHARELGIIFSNDPIVKEISNIFEVNWKRATAVPTQLPHCPKI